MQVDLGLFTVISPLCIDFVIEISGDVSQVNFTSHVRQFSEKADSFMVMPSKNGKI